MSLINKVIIFKDPKTGKNERALVLEKYFHHPCHHYIITSKGETIHLEAQHILEIGMRGKL